MGTIDISTRLNRRLRRNKAAILTNAEVEVLVGEARRAFGPELADLLNTSRVKFEDVIRWSSLGARCQQARADHGMTIRDVAVALKVPQYRLQAIEKGALRELKPTIARRYFQFLGIESWVRRWSRANRELARRAGMVPGATREGAS